MTGSPLNTAYPPVVVLEDVVLLVVVNVLVVVDVPRARLAPSPRPSPPTTRRKSNTSHAALRWERIGASVEDLLLMLARMTPGASILIC